MPLRPSPPIQPDEESSLEVDLGEEPVLDRELRRSGERKRPAGARSRRAHRRPVAALGVWLLVVAAGAWLALGGVHHGSRSALHLGLGLGLLGAAALSSRSLGHAGRLIPLARASAALLLAVAIGLLPVPRAVLSWVGPANAALRPDASLWTLSLDPERTVGELCDLALPLGAMLLAAAWGAAWWRRSVVESVARWSLLAVLAVATIHAASGTTRLFGTVETSLRPGQRFFAPFIDPNHAGTALALLLPAALAAVFDAEARPRVRIAWGAASTAAGAAILATHSAGALAAAAVATLLSAWWFGSRTARIGAAAASGGALLLAVPLAWTAGAGVSLSERLATWGAAISMLPGVWLAGSGGGTFERAIQPRVTAFHAWAHAHQDPTEWLLETGLIGAIAAVLAWRWLWKAAEGANTHASWARRSAVLWIGVTAVLVHALVDFPLQIPALSIGAAVAWGLRCTVFAPRVTIGAAPVRAVLATAGLIELAACAWEARCTAVERAVAIAWSERARTPPDAERTLASLAPWRPERDLVEGWRTVGPDPERAAGAARRAIAAHPEDGRALRAAAGILARTGAAEEAWTVYGQAIARHPGDWRTWVARAADAPADRRAEAWRSAFAAGAPPGKTFLEAAWAALPVGLVWVDAASDLDARFSVRLGHFLEEKDDLETAALAYEQAWLIDGEVPPAYIAALISLGRIEEATSLVRASLSAHPSDVAMRHQEAQLLEALEQWDLAADAWLAIGTSRPGAIARGLRALERARGVSEALAEAERLALTGRLDETAVLELARLQRDAGDPAACVTSIDTAGLLHNKRFGARARSLRASCEVGL